MNPSYDSKTAEVPAYDENDGDEIVLFRAPQDCLLANAVYTPAGDIRGDYYRSRSLTLRGRSEHRSESWVLADASTGGPEFLLPAGVAQNMAYFSTTVGLYLREGDEVLWLSSGYGYEDRNGIADPGGTVEVLMEEKSIEGEISRESWRECIPDYWMGKTFWLEYLEKPLSSLPPGGGGMQTWQYTGRLEEITDEGFGFRIPSGRLGVSFEEYGFRHDQLGSFRLIDEMPSL